MKKKSNVRRPQYKCPECASRKQKDNLVSILLDALDKHEWGYELDDIEKLADTLYGNGVRVTEE